MTTYLLDVNLLLALADPMHVHHDAAHRWFDARGRRAWATCPVTENGFVRISAHPNYPNRPGDATVVLGLLRRLCQTEGHHFWAEDISIRDVVLPDAVIASTQVTDIYLLALAVHNGGRLATLDHRLAASAVAGGTEALEVIPV